MKKTVEELSEDANAVENSVGEDVPTATSVQDPPKRRRGRPPGSKNKATRDASPGLTGTKLPIPPAAIEALGNAPYLLAGQLYAMRVKRSLDFTEPEQVRQMHAASLAALKAWLDEAGVEAPAWLVYAGTTATCIGAAIAVDQIKMKGEIEAQRARVVDLRKEREPKVVDPKPMPSVPIEDTPLASPSA